MATKPPRIALTKAEVEASLISQLKLLLMSCAQYDEGLEDAGKFIAVSLRILLNHSDKGTSKALLEQVGLRAERFYSTAAPFDARNMSTTSSLTLMTLGPTGPRFVAPLSDVPTKPRKIPFAAWWNEIVLSDSKKRQMSRRELVMNVANMEGAHADPELDEAYMDLSRNNSIGFVVSSGGVETPFPGPHLACMRQIAHEVLITLQEKRSAYFPTAYSPQSAMQKAVLQPEPAMFVSSFSFREVGPA
jgi:hypothetical protein